MHLTQTIRANHRETDSFKSMDQFLRPEAELKEFEPRLKFETRLK